MAAQSNPNVCGSIESHLSLYVLYLPSTQVQIVVNVTVHAPMSLQKYPYDRHIVPFCLATRATNDGQGKDKKETKWKLRKEWPEWAPSKFSEDETILSENQTVKDLEYHHKRCFVYLGGEKPILCVLIERSPVNIIKRVALPVFIMLCIALAVSGIKASTFEGKYNAALISLLTLTAFTYTVQSSLPKLPYLTWADCYFLVSTPVTLYPPSSTLMTPRCVLDQHCARHQFGFVFYLIIIIKVIIESQVSVEFIDDNLTIVLATLWALLHVILLLSTKYPSVVNNHVRLRSSPQDELDAPFGCLPSLADPLLRVPASHRSLPCDRCACLTRSSSKRFPKDSSQSHA